MDQLSGSQCFSQAQYPLHLHHPAPSNVPDITYSLLIATSIQATDCTRKSSFVGENRPTSARGVWHSFVCLVIGVLNFGFQVIKPLLQNYKGLCHSWNKVSGWVVIFSGCLKTKASWMLMHFA